uniref:Uncharacterized protein LOC100187130 n=1 Tax=Phallusia mammillata TaxID=59560 RepID=A0A6F9DI05_9ASCI|nr:uncharacterized protein LOC100187130 [Phallusia mammillata]
MLKHLHSAHRRSLSLLTDSSTSSVVTTDPTLTNYSQSNEKSSRKTPGQYSRSVKHRNKTQREGTVVQKCNRRNAHSQRIKASSVYIASTSTDEFLSDSKKSYDTSKLNKSRMRKFMQFKNPKPISEWTTEDACDWLKANQLDDDGKLSVQFRVSRICGRHLADPETAWNSMNRLNFQNSRQKQDVLLKLAECFREAKTVPKATKTDSHPKSKQRIRPPSSISHAESMVTSSDYVSGSSTSSTSATVPASSSSEHDQSNGEESTTSSSATSSNKVKKTLTQIRHAISKPKVVVSQAAPETSLLHSIVIHSDINSQDQFTPTELQITETTTTGELIQLFLDSAAINDDINLFVINDVTVPDVDAKDKKHKNRGIMSSRRMLESDECPLAVYRAITTSTRRNVTRRLELSQLRGVVMKVICRIGKHRPKGKQFRVSTQTSVDHVMRLALRKFRLRNVEPSLFALCEISVSGDVAEIPDTRKPVWRNGTSLLLCDRVTLKDINTGNANNGIPDFKRSCSMTSNLSSESRCSNGSDSWTPYNLDKIGRLTEELLEHEKERLTKDDSSNDDVMVEDVMPLTSESRRSSEATSFQSRLGSCSESVLLSADQQKADSLTVDNSMLRSQLRERDEQFDEVHRKVSQVRCMLESGLQRYHESVNQQSEINNGSSLALEQELKSTEQMISSTEDMLGQLFRHQRQLLARQKRNDSVTSSGDEQVTTALGTMELENVDSAALADVDLQIAVHQADLLALKHKHQVLDMKVSLFVAQRKAEKFRNMIHSSLYSIVSPSETHRCNGNNMEMASQFISEHPGYSIHSCEVFAGNSGYGLSLKDEVDTTRNNGRVRGTIVNCNYEQGRLLKGDRLLEVNGVNVQSVGVEFVARILKETISARLVVMRRRETPAQECNRCILNLPKDSQLTSSASPSTRSEDTDDDDVIMKDFDALKPARPGSEEMADWREMTALKSDLSMLMRELEVTSRAKRELERDMARKRNQDVVLESENVRLRAMVTELQKACRLAQTDST